MNPILKKVIAITSLVFVGAGTVFLIIYMVAPTLLGGASQWIAIASFGAGLLLYFSLYLVKAFPMQQEKERQRQQIEENYYNWLKEERGKIHGTEDAESEAPGETVSENEKDSSEAKLGDKAGNEMFSDGKTKR